MNLPTTPPPSPIALSLTVSQSHAPSVAPQDAVTNATIERGGDWVAGVGMSKRFGVIADQPEYWQLYYVKSAGGPQTILLAPDCFYRARIGGRHFGMYVDADGEINYLQKAYFKRELDRRFRDCAKTVDLTCDGDWSQDPFSNRIPEERLGENKLWLTAS